MRILRMLLAGASALSLVGGLASGSAWAAPEPAAVAAGPEVVVGAVVSVEPIESIAVDDYRAHFGFSVLNQATPATAVTKAAAPSNVVPGSTVTFTITVTAPTGSFLPTSFNVRDFLGSAFTFVSAAAGSGVTSVSCATAPTTTTPPSGADPNSQQLLCALTVPASTSTATFTITATVNAGAFSSAQLTNAAAAPFLRFDPQVLAPTAPAIGQATVQPAVAPAVAVVVPPPLPLLPPPPPPLLAPPRAPAPMAMPPVGAEIPVIPEADSLALLAGGLVALALGAAWRRRR
jgi:hypothetical protein